MSDSASPFKPPQATVIGNKKPERDRFKTAGFFLLKCVVFSVVFWTTWVFAIRPLTNSMSSSNMQSSQAQDDQSNALMKKYWEQAREADTLQTEYKRQAAESARLLEQQDQLLRRFDSIIQRWESQPSGRK